MSRGKGIDDVDRRLVALLGSDGRAKLADLAEATGMSVSAVQSRVRRLEESGVITGYRAVVNAASLGRPMSAFVEIFAEPQVDDAVPGALEQMPEVTACWSVAGDATHLAMIDVADAGDLDLVLTRIRAAVHGRTRTMMVLRSHFEKAVPSAR